MSVRNMRRMRLRHIESGCSGIFEQWPRKRSIHRIPVETAERVLASFRDKYFDLSARQLNEKLKQDESISRSYGRVRHVCCREQRWCAGRASEARTVAGVPGGRCSGILLRIVGFRPTTPTT